ncbi:hypothetical protein Tco_0788943 [Tanacetum coccineum]
MDPDYRKRRRPLQAPPSPDYVPSLEDPEQAPHRSPDIFQAQIPSPDLKANTEEDDDDDPPRRIDDVDIKKEADEEEEREEHPAPTDSVVVCFNQTTDHGLHLRRRQSRSRLMICDTPPTTTRGFLTSSLSTPPPHPAYRVTARISIKDKTPISLPPREEVERLLAMPTPPSSPLSPWPSPLP